MEGFTKNHLPVPVTSPSSKYIVLPPSNNHDTAVIASLDGMIYLVERNSGKVRWSFSSGPALSSSYHASLEYSSDSDDEYELEDKQGTTDEYDYFIECGDDGNLYEQSRHFGRRKLPKTIEEYVNSPPHVLNGAITFGHKKLTIFLVDALTGRVLNTFRPQDFQSVIGGRNDEQSLISQQEMGDLFASSSLDITTIEPLMIMRTDYSLQSVLLISKDPLWNMTVAKINAVSLSQGSENARHSLGYKGDVEMSLPVVYPSLDSYLIESELAFPLPNNLLESHHKDEVLSLPAPQTQSSLLSLPAPQTQSSSNLKISSENQILPDQLRKSCEVKKTCLMEIDDGSKQIVAGVFEVTVLSFFYQKIKTVLSLIIVLVSALYYQRWFKQAKSSDKQPRHLNGKQTVSTKKRKARQKGNYKNIANINKQDNHVSSESEDPETNSLTNANCTKVDEDCDGRWVGKLFVSNKEIAKGSNGTVVFEGIVYDDQHPEGIVYDLQHPVAVKRLVLAHNDVAFKEIKILRESKHSNIVHLYGVERDLDFVYIALERCTCSLNDLIQLYSDASLNLLSTGSPISNFRREYKVQLESRVGIDESIDLWGANGYPSSQLLKLMRDVVFGLAHLHELGIIHRDLKPHNVLISSGKSLCAKLADMGISKRLHSGMSSLGHHVTGNGSSGWQAPEQLLHGRQTRAMDLFSFGCLLFFCITKGRHPFGDYLERDANIVKNQFDFFLVEHLPEAVDLLSHLLEHDPEKRPKAEEVLHHPLFWSSEKRLLFLQDASDRVELADRVGDSDILQALENVAPVALNGNWDEKMEATFIKNIGNYRRYKYDSIRDLLRLIRNKSNHYIDLPQEVQELVGPYPDGCYDYFARRFPKLLIEVYKVIYSYCRDEILFRKYFKCDLIIH